MESRAPAYLSICAIYRDEAPYLREWVAFHRLVGVERFFLYNNRSSDEHREALAPYIADGTVELTDWDDHPAQVQTYDDCIRTHRDDSRWIAFIDLDEFLFSPSGKPVPEILSEYERWPGVGVNWAVYGTSGHEEKPAGLVIENYVRRTDDPGFNRPIKSIADPKRIRNFCLAHYFMYRDEPGVAVDENQRPISGPQFSRTESVSFARLRINHYFTKSEAEFRAKIAKGYADGWTRPKHGEMEERKIVRQLGLYDEIEDRTIQRYLPELRRALEEIDATGVAPGAASS
jgi:hypothetical protein